MPQAGYAIHTYNFELEIHNFVENYYQYDPIHITIEDVCKHILTVITVCSVYMICVISLLHQYILIKSGKLSTF